MRPDHASHDPSGMMPAGSGCPVAWRCETEVVVVKPAGISSEGAADAALERVRRSERWPLARLPHRLDRVTRGFLLVARDAASAARHAEAIRARSWVKVYLARLSGRDPTALVGKHKAFLKRDRMRATVVRSGGDPAFLDILAVAQAPEREGQWHAVIRLHTGRYHQIRIMCSHLGCPLAGDVEYGAARSVEDPSPMLEHAVFSFPSAAEGSGRVTLWNPNDPNREPIAQSVVDALAAAAGSANAIT